MKKPCDIATRPGDGGMTRLFSGEKVPKDALQPEVCGTVDELNSVLGLARLHARRPETRDVLLALQRELFLVGAEAATAPERAGDLPGRIGEENLRALDALRQRLDKDHPMPADFVIPAGSLAAAHLDHARTVARRCERRMVTLVRSGGCRNEHILPWLNRLSDALWRLARAEEPAGPERPGV